jgi:hypothetical protein
MATIVKLKAGETALVAAVREGDKPDQGLPPPEKPVDPGYGIDLGLGYLRPTHPIVLPPPVTPPTEPPAPVDPAYGIDIDQGYVRPEHPIVLPPPDIVPGWKLTTAWTPVTGWVVVAVPTGPIATPSKKK